MDSKFHQFISEVSEASKTILKYFGQELELDMKSTASDFRTKADTETEEKIIESINKLFPEYNIYGEESGLTEKDSEYKFIIDPLDGTNNFSLHIPLFTSSVGLVRNDEIIFGLICNPITNVNYYAYKDEGAFANGKRIQVNKISDIENTTVSYTCGYGATNDQINKVHEDMNNLNIKRFMHLWSPAYMFCLLASGKIEAIINDDNEIYDFVAGKLIAKEAGALSTTFDGSAENDLNSRFLITNGSNIHSTLTDKLN